MDKFQNKYRIDSARRTNWDYRWPAAYFITICTKNRECYFGEVINGQMQLSETGIIADILWHEMVTHTNHVELGQFVVMPNHVHGIVIIGEQNDEMDGGMAETLRDGMVETLRDGMVETLHATSLRGTERNAGNGAMKNAQMASISPKTGSLSAIVRSYKSAVSKHAHRLGFDFAWQTRFHDHIIRNEKSFQTISEYILNNPKRWDSDKFHQTNQ